MSEKVLRSGIALSGPILQEVFSFLRGSLVNFGREYGFFMAASSIRLENRMFDI